MIKVQKQADQIFIPVASVNTVGDNSDSLLVTDIKRIHFDRPGRCLALSLM